jgi:hypothetical protein
MACQGLTHNRQNLAFQILKYFFMKIGGFNLLRENIFQYVSLRFNRPNLRIASCLRSVKVVWTCRGSYCLPGLCCCYNMFGGPETCQYVTHVKLLLGF